MDKLIKIWVIVIITTVSAILLPTVAFGFDEENYDIVESYKGVRFARPFPTAQITYMNDDGTVSSKRFEMGSNINDNGAYCGAWALVRVYYYYDKRTVLTLFPIYYDSVSNNWTGCGSGINVCGMAGDVPLSTILKGATNIALFKDYGEVWTNSNAYGNDFIYDYFNNDNTNGVVNTDGFNFNPDTDEWLPENTVYDLEIVEGLKIAIPSNYNKDYYTLTWKPSTTLQNQPYYKDVELEIYEIPFGRVKDKIWDTWSNYGDFWKFLIGRPKAYNEKYKFKQTDFPEFESFVRDTLLNGDNDGYILEEHTSDLLVRYRYIDDNEVVHYSKNFVYVATNEDGTYKIDVPEDDNLDDIYKDSPDIEQDIYQEDPYEPEKPTTDVDEIWGSIESLFNMLLDFPKYFARIFGFLPSWVISLIAFGIGAIVVIGIAKVVF